MCITINMFTVRTTEQKNENTSVYLIDTKWLYIKLYIIVNNIDVIKR